MMQPSGEIGLDEWLIKLLNSQTLIHLRWEKHPADRLFLVIKLKSNMNIPKHIKYNHVIKYVKHKRKSSSPEQLGEQDLENYFDDFVAELRSCSWCRYVGIEDKQDRQIYRFEITRQILTSSEIRSPRRQSSSSRPPASMMVPSNRQNYQQPEMSLPLRNVTAQSLGPHANFSQRDSPRPSMGAYQPQSSGNDGGSQTPTNQSLNLGISFNPAMPQMGSSTAVEIFQQYCQRKNISRDRLKRFEVRIFVTGRMVTDQPNASLMNDGFQVCYGNQDNILSIIRQHEPQIQALLAPVGFNRAQINPSFIIERDVKQALDAFICGGVLFKYNNADDSVVLYRFSQTRVFVESHLHDRPHKLERFCRANHREPPTVVFSYPKYVVEGRRSTKYINLKIGSSKIKVELTPKDLDSFAADFPVNNPSRGGSMMMPQSGYSQQQQQHLQAPRNSAAYPRSQPQHSSFTINPGRP